MALGKQADGNVIFLIFAKVCIFRGSFGADSY